MHVTVYFSKVTIFVTIAFAVSQIVWWYIFCRKTQPDANTAICSSKGLQKPHGMLLPSTHKEICNVIVCISLTVLSTVNIKIWVRGHHASPRLSAMRQENAFPQMYTSFFSPCTPSMWSLRDVVDESHFSTRVISKSLHVTCTSRGMTPQT